VKPKKLTPRNSAPVQRENTATVSRDGDGNAIAPSLLDWFLGVPFAGDDARE